MTGSCRNHRITAVIFCLALVTVTAAVYGRVCLFDFVDFDDGLFVTANPQVTAGLTWNGVKWAFSSTVAFWNPVTRLSHMLDAELFGLDPAGHHLSNLILHMLNSVLLFLVMWRMTGAFGRSALVAVVFAVHPLNVEAVAWVSERKGLLCALFWILGLGAYSRYADRPGIWSYTAVFTFFVLSLMAKPMAVTFPLILLLLDYWPLKREGVSRLILEKAPLLAVSAGAAVLAIHAEQVIGALPAMEIIPPGHRIANALTAYVAYLGKAFVPVRLAVFYPFQEAFPIWKTASAASVLGVISAAAWRFRGVRPYLLVGWLWYLITLVPVIGFIKVGAFSMADRYAYMPLTGITVAVVWFAWEVLRGRRAWRAPAVIAAVVMIGVLAATAREQSRHWEDSFGLFSHAVRVTERNALAYNNLGMAVFKQGDPSEAVRYFEKALDIWPGYGTAQRNLGGALSHIGRFEEAEQVFRQILDTDDEDAETWRNLGMTLAVTGRQEEGLASLRRALAIRPGYAEAHYNIGIVLSRQGRLVEAEKHYRAALEIRPDYANAHNNLGVVLLRQGKVDEAARHFEACIELDPGRMEARRNRARLR